VFTLAHDTISLQPLKRPHLIRETPLSTLWHKKDDRFWVPKAQVIIDLRRFVLTHLALSHMAPDAQHLSLQSFRQLLSSHLSFDTVRQSHTPTHRIFLSNIVSRLYSDIVNDALTEFSYDADLAGLSYHFVQHTTGLFVAMNGYNDKMSVLVQHVLEKLKGIIVNPERLAVMKEQVCFFNRFPFAAAHGRK